MNLTKRIISSALVLSMATLAIPVGAYATSNTIKGQVFFEDGSPAAGVKINILSSTIDEVYDDDVVGFSNNYYTSVYTDSNGTYEFNRPSDYCLVKVDLDSLPTKTGISSESSFLYPGETIEPFTIYKIADIGLNADNSVEVYNKNGEVISTPIDIGSSLSGDNITDIVNSDNIDTTYTINANDFLTELNTTYDFSDYSVIEKADILFEQGLLSHEDVLATYLYAIENEECNDMECFNPVYDALADYYNDADSSNLSLKNKIITTLALPADRDITQPSVEQMSDFFKKPKTVRVGKFTLHYETQEKQTDTVSAANLSSIKSILSNISNSYFNTWGFEAKKMEDGESTYHVYLDDESITANGLTTKAQNGRFIIINYTDSDYKDQNFARTAAHETFHIIQEIYKKRDKSVLSWFKEAGASWAGMEYIDSYCSWGNSFANKYLISTDSSLISDDSNHYGAYLFYKYVSLKYDDVKDNKAVKFSAMKRILEAYTIQDDIYKAFAYCPASGKTSYKALFAGFQAYNADPSYYTYSNGKNSYKKAKYQELSSGEIEIKPSSAHHYSFNATSKSSRIDFTVSMAKTDCSKMAVSIAKFSSGNKTKLMRYFPSNTESYTFSVTGYSTSAGKINSITVAVSNAGHSSADSFNYSLSSKVS